jgi:hypothetical protein
LHQLGYVLIKARPKGIKQDKEKVKEFRETFPSKYKDEDIRFYDETWYKSDQEAGKEWSRKGTKPPHYYQGNHVSCGVMGSVSPKTGELEALLVPYVDNLVFQSYLDYLKEQTGNKRLVLVMDNARWHKVKSLEWGNIIPVYLPEYSPELNPIEELWKVMKARTYNAYPAKNREELYDRLQEVLRYFFQNPEEVKSICKLTY